MVNHPTSCLKKEWQRLFPRNPCEICCAVPHLLHLLDSIILNSQKTVMQTKALNSDAMRSKLEPKPKCAHFFQHYILLSKIFTMRLCTNMYNSLHKEKKQWKGYPDHPDHPGCQEQQSPLWRPRHYLLVAFLAPSSSSSSRRMMQLHFHELSSRWRRRPSINEAILHPSSSRQAL